MTKDFRFTATKDVYHAYSGDLKFDLSQPSIVCTFRRRNNPKELILAIGETQDNLQRDPTYQNVADQGEFRFYDPFEPRTFNAFIAEAVIRYYIAKASNTRTTMARILAIILGDKFDIQLDLSGYENVSRESQTTFEASLSSIGMLRIKQKPNKHMDGTR